MTIQALEATQMLPEPVLKINDGPPARQPGRLSWILGALGGAIQGFVHRLLGGLSLIVGLSILATIPIIQLISLGYLLEASGRVAKSGRLRDGLPGWSTAAHLGVVAIGFFLSLMPMRIMTSFANSSRLLNGDVPQVAWLQGWGILFGVMGVWHIGWALFRGGRIRDFAWPAPLRFLRRWRAGGMYTEASHRLHAFWRSLPLARLFWLGLRGFVGAFVWLFIPVTLMAVSSHLQPTELGGLCALVGGLIFAWVLLYLPFLQTKLPITDRFASQFQWRQVRRDFVRAPIAYWFSLLVTLAFAIPLYLLKAELIPREAAWLPSLFFVMLALPSRLLVGWGVSRARRRDLPRHWIFRWASRFAAVPVVLIYALIVYFTQFTSWYGAWSLFEQHAFLVPVPFF